MSDKKIRVPMSLDDIENLKKARLIYIDIHGLQNEMLPLRKFYNIIMNYGIDKFENKYNRKIK